MCSQLACAFQRQLQLPRSEIPGTTFNAEDPIGSNDACRSTPAAGAPTAKLGKLNDTSPNHRTTAQHSTFEPFQRPTAACVAPEVYSPLGRRNTKAAG